jgi:hypothetical protein
MFVLLVSGSGHLFSLFPSGSCTNLLMGEKWFPSFFHLPVIVLVTVTVPVLCVIQYCLACNNNDDDILNGRVRGERKQRK